MQRKILCIFIVIMGIVLMGCPEPGIDQVTVSKDYTPPTLKYVPAGSFQRDSGIGNISTITTAFRMSEKEITMEQFVAVTGLGNPSISFTGVVNGPVQMTNWYHTLVFCNKLSIAEGLTPVYTIRSSTIPDAWDGTTDGTITVPLLSGDVDWDAATADWGANGYRLPTEMEWMWAAMGATSDRSNGYMGTGTNTTGYTKGYAGSAETADAQVNIGNYAWYGGNSDSTTHPAGTKLPNELGLYNMGGNVFEWNWDRYAAYPSGTLTDYTGAASGTDRVVRGGSWENDASFCTVGGRNPSIPDYQVKTIGFRVVLP